MKQQGYATVEFALVGTVFFIVLFGIFDISRMLFTWNTLTEVTRRGTSVAVNCPVNHSSIKRLAVFNSADSDAESTAIAGLYPHDITLEYLDEDGDVLASPSSSYLLIRFVSVSINSGFEYTSLIPGLSAVINPPEFKTVLPIESLGVVRTGSTPICNGTTS